MEASQTNLKKVRVHPILTVKPHKDVVHMRCVCNPRERER